MLMCRLLACNSGKLGQTSVWEEECVERVVCGGVKGRGEEEKNQNNLNSFVAPIQALAVLEWPRT